MLKVKRGCSVTCPWLRVVVVFLCMPPEVPPHDFVASEIHTCTYGPWRVRDCAYPATTHIYPDLVLSNRPGPNPTRPATALMTRPCTFLLAR